MINTPIDKPGARHAAVAVWRLSPTAALRQSLASASDYLALTKPRVMALAVFTAVVGLFAAPGRISPLTVVLTVLCVAMGAGAAGALNMWYDADIDRLMSRTAARPVPRGRISPRSVLLLGTSAAVVSVLLLATIANVTAAALLALTIPWEPRWDAVGTSATGNGARVGIPIMCTQKQESTAPRLISGMATDTRRPAQPG